jgi:transposase-like protein
LEDYPRNLAEFERRFQTEEACRDYLFRLRWPGGFRCPRCGQDKAWPVRGLLYECSRCAYQLSVTAGTIFHQTHKPLQAWFRAIWWVTSQKTGASAAGIQAILGLGSYKTAWTWLHKLRRAMVRPGRDRLSGSVEVDEAYVGGLDEGHRGRRVGKKALIAIAAQEDGRKIGRIRMQRVADASAVSLHAFVKQVVEPGALVRTDGWAGYQGLQGHGYEHLPSPQTGPAGSEDDLLPRVHRVVSLLKRWLMGTHHGAVSQEHLDYYLDEFTFRFNRRSSQYRGKLFYRLLQQAVAVDPAPFKILAKHVRGRRSHNRQCLPEQSK